MIKLVLASGAALLAVPAFAQTAVPGGADPDARRDIIVTGVVETSERDVLQGTSVISGEEDAASALEDLEEDLEDVLED